MGIEIVLASLAAGGTVASTLTAVYGVVGAAAIQLGISAIGSAIAASFVRKPQQQQIKRDLNFPTSRPPYRFPYGRDRVPGTPMPYPVVGDFAYACWLISSRPTTGDFTVWIDNREVTLTGDPYDFSATGGATATEFPFEDHLTIWIGRGDHTQPPQVFLDEAGYVTDGDELLWKATDAGQGCTMVFARLKAGSNGQRSERWPSAVPQLELEGRMSKVWDLRDPAQVSDDPATWTWSDNAALIALDVLRNNPFRPYELRNLQLPMWEGYADACDEVVGLKSGGSEPRYVASGVVVFDGSELESILQPVLACGGARLVDQGGQRGVVGAVPRTPLSPITESLGGLSFSSLLDDASLVTEVRVNYSPAARGGEPAELAPWSIPGALAADGGQPSVKTLDLSMCPSATQAQRLRNIFGKTARLQRRVQLVAPPSALEAVSGSVVPLALPAPYGAHVDGLYEVQSIGAATNIVSRDGIALRCPVSLSEYSAAVFDWDPAVDEEDVVHAAFDSQRYGVGVPGALSVTSGPGVDLDNGGTIVPRFLFEFGPSVSSGVETYEWQSRLPGEDYQAGGVVPGDLRNDNGSLEFYLTVQEIGLAHAVRVRAVTATGTSDWTELTGAIYQIDPIGVAATAARAHAVFTGTAPVSTAFRGFRVKRADVGAGFAAAVDVSDLLEVDAGTAFSIVAGVENPTLLSDNVEFDTVDDWLLTEFTISGGEASKTSSANGRVQLAPAMVEGEAYRFEFDVSSYTSGTVRAFVSGTGIASGTIAMAAGSYSSRVVAVPDPTRVGLLALGGFVGSVDNLSIYLETPEHLPHGAGDYYLVPVTLTGSDAAPSGPYTLSIT